MGNLPILQCKDLRKSCGSLTAVDGVSFEIANGETYGLLGPNGAGKTTVISTVCGLLESSGRAVLIDGVELTSRSVGVKSAIGLVPQEVVIYPDLSGHENLRFFASLYGIRGKKAANRIAAVLEIIGLTDRADDATKEYSGGMKRRLNIGIGLLHEPKLLVLDEPTVGVDPQSRNAILASIAQLGEEGSGCCTPPTTWKRRSACGTGWALSTAACYKLAEILARTTAASVSVRSV